MSSPTPDDNRPGSGDGKKKAAAKGKKGKRAREQQVLGAMDAALPSQRKRRAGTLDADADGDANGEANSGANGDADSYEMPLEVMQGHLNAAVAERDVRRREADTEKEAWSECERDRRAAERLSEQARTRADEERTERELRIEEDLETARQEQRRRQERNQAS